MHLLIISLLCICCIVYAKDPMTDSLDALREHIVNNNVIYDTNGFFNEKNYKKSALFVDYLHEYNKVYKSNEIVDRFNIFCENMEFIENHNSKNHSYTLGLTRFTDMTDTEFKQMLTTTINVNSTSQLTTKALENDIQNSPSRIDWRTRGAVTGVKDQGSCGCCWAFAATQTTEGLVAIKTGKLTSLSVQDVMDCDTRDNGCQGGLVTGAYNYMISNNGTCSDATYPFIQADSTCKSKSCSNVQSTNIKSYHGVTSNNEQILGNYIAQQPIAVLICSLSPTFRHYVSGVYDDPSCYNGNFDHYVLIVGYDDTAPIPYYIVKNSWGTSWGESGYIMMKRNPNGADRGICGLATQPSYPSY